MKILFLSFLLSLAVIVVYIFGHGNSNKLVLGADSPFLAKGLLLIVLNGVANLLAYGPM